VGALRNVMAAVALAAGVTGAGAVQAHDGRWGGPRYYYAPPPPVFYAPRPPIYYAPRPIYVPPPVYYAPRRVFVPPPPVYYAPRPHYGGGWGHGRGDFRRW